MQIAGQGSYLWEEDQIDNLKNTIPLITTGIQNLEMVSQPNEL